MIKPGLRRPQSQVAQLAERPIAAARNRRKPETSMMQVRAREAPRPAVELGVSPPLRPLRSAESS
eukprot:10879457-Alexandrium_andersonii.AAC.1